MLSRRCFVTTSASTGLAYVLGGLETGEAQTYRQEHAPHGGLSGRRLS